MVAIELEGQVAVLTGGSRGIGARAVQLLAAAGANVVFTYRRDGSAARSVLQAARQAGGNSPASRVVALRADATRPAASRRLIAEAVRRFGRVDIAIANAGMWKAEDLAVERITPGQWRAMLAANLDSAYALAAAAVAQMKRQRTPRGRPPGRIIFVASTAAQRGEALHADYAAAKGGVIALARGLSTEVARQGILVNVVAPGWVDTDMSAPILRSRPAPVLAKIPLGRVGRPEELAGCILFLCTPWSNFMTGSVLSANGGAVLA
ncbi:MAG: SDR family NAD(P)-dependent oxidoreductase [Terriglobales bacterium]